MERFGAIADTLSTHPPSSPRAAVFRPLFLCAGFRAPQVPKPQYKMKMNIIAVFKHHTGMRLAEVAFLLIGFAGVWLAAADIRQGGFGRARGIVAGAAFAVAGVLLIVATRRYHYG